MFNLTKNTFILIVPPGLRHTNVVAINELINSIGEKLCMTKLLYVNIEAMHIVPWYLK